MVCPTVNISNGGYTIGIKTDAMIVMMNAVKLVAYLVA